MIDPTASAPEFWSEEDDGVWEPPMVGVLTVRGWPRMRWELEMLAVDSAPWLLVGLVVGALLERDGGAGVLTVGAQSRRTHGC